MDLNNLDKVVQELDNNDSKNSESFNRSKS